MHFLLIEWSSISENSPVKNYALHLISQFALHLEKSNATPGQGSTGGNLIEPLSAREIEVLTLIADGKTNKEIALQLFVSPGTVKAHTSNIYRKLDVANRTEAVARARQLKFLS
ncbi:MAG: response regulator transcription factor [Anaerolineaceae bacterium]|nr:response regulator transcription factor [Anaerolineaceae bacterium]